MEKIIKVDVTPTVSTSPAYTSADAIGGLMEFSALLAFGWAELLAIRLIDKSNQKSAMDLLLFDQFFTATADNAAIAVAAADCPNLIGRISIASGDWTSIQSGRAEATKQLSPALPLVSGGLDSASSKSTSLYAQLVARGTPTYAATSDLLVRLYARVKNGS